MKEQCWILCVIYLSVSFNRFYFLARPMILTVSSGFQQITNNIFETYVQNEVNTGDVLILIPVQVWGCDASVKHSYP